MRYVTHPAMIGPLAALAALASSPATAGTVLVGDTQFSPNQSFTLLFDGQSSGSTIAGLQSELKLTFTGVEGNNWSFAFDVWNRSDSTHSASTVSGFGFNTDPFNPVIASSSEISPYGRVSTGSIANGNDIAVDFCVIGSTSGGPNCAGGANNGPNPGSKYSGTFTMAFGTSFRELVLSNFHTRYQSTSGGEGSATGFVTSFTSNKMVSGVPEPSTWAMMLLGFGAVGFAMRRQRAGLRPALRAA